MRRRRRSLDNDLISLCGQHKLVFFLNIFQTKIAFMGEARKTAGI